MTVPAVMFCLTCRSETDSNRIVAHLSVAEVRNPIYLSRHTDKQHFGQVGSWLVHDRIHDVSSQLRSYRPGYAAQLSRLRILHGTFPLGGKTPSP